jgi:biotin transport system substrate-specific component
MTAAPNVLIDNLTHRHSRLMNALWVVGFGLLTALLAQIRIPLPFTPVPLTGQTFAVLLAGAALGSRRAFLSQALYLAAGAAGLPVFAGGGATVACLLGPTGGYLWSFPLAAALLGWLVERGAGRRVWTLALSLVLSDAVILASGALWLHGILGLASQQTGLQGLYPFVVADVLKVALVGLTLPAVLRRSGQSASH